MRTFLTIILIEFSLGIHAQNHDKSYITKAIHVSSLTDLDKLQLNFCDTFSIEAIGLYPISQMLPSIDSEKVLLKTLLIKNGFVKTDAGWGNWEKGPRFFMLTYQKDNCNCRVYKRYYLNEKMKDGDFNMKVTETISCNSDKFTDRR